MMTTDEARLAELAHPESEMASLPWAVMTVDEFSHDGWGATRRFIQFDGQPALESIAEVWFGATEAEYIALAANLAPALLAERDALLAQSAALRDQLARAEAVVQAARDWLACEVRAVALTTQIFEHGAGFKGPDDYYPTDAEHAQLVELSEDGIAVEEALRAAVQALAARTPTPGAAGAVETGR